MKVISLLQPWATLVVIGAKKIETRSWNTKFRGSLLIHASAGKKAAKELVDITSGENEFRRFIRHWTDLPFGAIIGQAEIIGTAPTDFYTQTAAAGTLLHPDLRLEDWKQEFAFGDYTLGRYGWLLTNTQLFQKPIPAKGSLGLWEYKGPINQLSAEV